MKLSVNKPARSETADSGAAKPELKSPIKKTKIGTGIDVVVGGGRLSGTGITAILTVGQPLGGVNRNTTLSGGPVKLIPNLKGALKKD